MGLQCSITAIGSVIMQWAVNVLGSTAVAAVTAAGKTQSLLTVPMESVGTAMATYAGQNLGASRMDRVRQGVNSAMLIILVYGVGSALILHFTDVQIMSLFLDTAKEVDIVAMGREYLFWNSVFFVPLGALIVWRYSCLLYTSFTKMCRDIRHAGVAGANIPRTDARRAPRHDLRCQKTAEQIPRQQAKSPQK